MRLLYLSLMSPVPINNGARMRTSSLLRALADEGHTTTLVSFAEPGETEGYQSTVAELCAEAVFVPRVTRSLTARAGFLGRLGALATSRPYAVRRFRSASMRSELERQLRDGSPEAVVCDSVYSLVNLPHTDRLILDCPNVEHVILQRYSSVERSPLKRVYAWLEARKLRLWEQAGCRRATLAMACSPRDEAALLELRPDLPIRVVPNTLDLSRYESPGATPSGEPTILYTGGMDWFPNRDAVSFFVDSIWPRVRAALPTVRFVIAGRNPTAEQRRTLGPLPGIELTGTVPDMRPLIAQATVIVVPLRIGSGTRLKILEAGAMKKAVVTTSVGLEGLDFHDGNEVVVADNPEIFASRVIGLVKDDGYRTELGLAARRRVEESYSQPAMRRAVGAALTSLR